MPKYFVPTKITYLCQWRRKNTLKEVCIPSQTLNSIRFNVHNSLIWSTLVHIVRTCIAMLLIPNNLINVCHQKNQHNILIHLWNCLITWIRFHIHINLFFYKWLRRGVHKYSLVVWGFQTSVIINGGEKVQTTKLYLLVIHIDPLMLISLDQLFILNFLWKQHSILQFMYVTKDTPTRHHIYNKQEKLSWNINVPSLFDSTLLHSKMMGGFFFNPLSLL